MRDHRHEPVPPNSVLVGRVEPLRALGHLLELASSGSGAAALITGEAGVGKTFLTRQLAERARGLLVVAWAACSEEDTSPGSGPWHEIVAQMLAATTAANRAVPLRDDLEEIAAGKGLAEIAGQDLMTAGFGTSRAIAGLARACGPTLLVLDDLHWADHASLAVLERLLHVATELPLLIIATAREAEIWKSGPRRPVFQRLLRNALPIALDPFTYDEAQQLLAAMGRPTAAATVHRLMTLTAGNPFLLCDLLRREGSSDTAGHTTTSLGGKLFLDARIESIPPETRSLLATLAILGREVPQERLHSHFAGDQGRLARTLDAAVADGVLVRLPGLTPRVGFSNDLLREAVLARIPHAERERLHLEAAQKLGYAADEPAAGVSPIEIARHLREALPLSGATQLERWARRAGAAALAGGDPVEAANWFQTAVDCHGELEPTTPCPADLLLDLAQARTYTGDRGQGTAICAALVERARAAGDSDLLARATLATTAPHSIDGSVRWEELDLLAEALGAADGANIRLVSALRARVSTLLSFSSDTKRCRALAESAVTEARRLGDSLHLRSVLPALRLAVWGPDDVPAQERLSAELLDLANAAPRSAALLNQARVWKSLDALAAGSQSKYESNLQAWQAESGAGLHPTRLSSLRLAEGNRDIMMGRLDAADARLTATEFDLEGMDDGNVMVREQCFLAQRLAILREWQRAAERETQVAIMAGRAPDTSLWQPLHALLHLDEGRIDEAREALTLAHARGFAARPRNGTWLNALATWAEIAAALGAAAAAGELHDLLAPHAQRHVVVISGADCWGSVHRFLGLLENTLERPQEAIASFERALVADRSSGNLLWAAHDRVLLARALQTEDSPTQQRRAERMLAESLEFGRAHTLPRLIAQIESAAAAARPATASGSTAGDSPARRETRTASLRRTGATWWIAFRGQDGMVRDSRGMAQIQRLLQNPGVALLARDLFWESAPGSGADKTSRARDGLGAAFGSPAEPMLDDRARADIRRRIHKLGAELAACEESADLGRAETLRAEHEILVEQLSRSLGLGGRARGMASADERARVNVTRRIRSALRDIAVVSPLLGSHLQRQITTGRLCSYDPDPVSPLEFDLD